ncbi:arsenate reductase/protein-tyrosine-phosphatase family protein [Vibrio alfacsensis]|uniref:arsenate reductase/protein-tyrosine-phosphatase family protein n=1 Tax=Vibrio TaxID=662 RepID=UPI00406853F0
MFNKILVVCVGNICRSPIAERMLASMLPNKDIASAGIASAKSGLVGKPADKTAIDVAAEHGVDLNNHASQQLTSELCKEYDLILVMEKDHIEALTSIAPEARGKTMLLGQWIEQKQIPDPYRQSRDAFEFVYQLIEQSAKEWQKRL